MEGEIMKITTSEDYITSSHNTLNFSLEAGDEGLNIYVNNKKLKGELKALGLKYYENRGKIIELENKCDDISMKLLEALKGDE